MKALFACIVLSIGLATAASAVTIDISDYSADRLDDATGALSHMDSEDFERVGAVNGVGEVAPGTALQTTVGSFSTLGGRGNGGTVTGLFGNTGQNLALRTGNVYGRRDIAGGGFFLDSNDTHGIGWDVRSSQGAFNTVIFALTDASEYSYLRIIADGVAQEQTNGRRLGNGATSLVQITFDRLVTDARIELVSYSSYGGARVTNDGFSIDAASVGIAPIPLPASLPLLLMGLGALAYYRRSPTA